ncbi:MAG: hypothetical protein KF687_12675 [Cyclobacteriaceae bacterium]|nr:hypothetical protein [Cyclobacteriaceae bacterium]
MKLSRIAGFGAIIFLAGLVIQLIHPADGIIVTEKFRLYFPATSQVFTTQNRAERERLRAILEEESDRLSKLANEKADSIRSIFVRDSIRKAQLSIHYPNNDRSILNGFFKTLDNIRVSKQPIHIVHYGDSQIEGDRITAYIRQKLQEQFGGKGPGWLPVKPLAYPRSLTIQHSDNWRSFHFYNRGDSSLNHRLYGHMGIFSRFTPYPDSTTEVDTQHHAWISYKPSARSHPTIRKFKDVRIFYGNITSPVSMELLNDETVVFTAVLQETETPQVVRYTAPFYMDEITLRFTSSDSPDIYGVSLDDTQGIMVDNVAMRGDSGASFTSLEDASFRTTFNQFNVPLFILQFGGNAVPYAKTDERIDGYARNFKRNLQYLKRLKPDAAIIVIGPSDMSVLEGTKWITYRQLEQVRDALKSATHEAGAAYWDLYEAMGGKGSMVEWVNADPPLAIKDYTHFTDKGALKAGQWFTEALLRDYQFYKQQKENVSVLPEEDKSDEHSN